MESKIEEVNSVIMPGTALHKKTYIVCVLHGLSLQLCRGLGQIIYCSTWNSKHIRNAPIHVRLVSVIMEAKYALSIYIVEKMVEPKFYRIFQSSQAL